MVKDTVKYWKVDMGSGLTIVGKIVKSQIHETTLETLHGETKVVSSYLIEPATRKEYFQSLIEAELPVYELCAQG